MKCPPQLGIDAKGGPAIGKQSRDTSRKSNTQKKKFSPYASNWDKEKLGGGREKRFF